MPPIIMPTKAVALVARLAGQAIDPVRVSLSSSRAKFEIDGITVVTKLIDGTFPDYRRVFPKANDTHFTCPTSGLAAAIDRIMAVATSKLSGVKFELGPKGQRISVRDVDSGSGEEAISGSFAGQPIEIGFNRHYIRSLIRRIDAEEVTLTLGDQAGPITVVDSVRPTVTFVLMPMLV